MKRAYIGLAVYVLAAALSQGAAQRTFKAYPVFPTRAPAMVEVIQEMIGSEGKVIYDGSASQLLVSATPEAHSKIVAILEEVNVPVRNVRIDVLISEHTRNSSSALGLDGSGGIVVRPHGSSAKPNLPRPVHQHPAWPPFFTSDPRRLRLGCMPSRHDGKRKGIGTWFKTSDC